MKIASWRTTACSLGALFALVGGALNQMYDGNPATNPDWEVTIPLMFAALSGLFARDNKVTSEQAGAKPPVTITQTIDPQTK